LLRVRAEERLNEILCLGLSVLFFVNLVVIILFEPRGGRILFGISMFTAIMGCLARLNRQRIAHKRNDLVMALFYIFRATTGQSEKNNKQY
jgi:hypothetical protein